MAAIITTSGHQLSEQVAIQKLNFLDAGLTAAEILPLSTAGLPEFRDAVRAMFILVDAGLVTVDMSNLPDDGDSVRTTRNKINWTWENIV